VKGLKWVVVMEECVSPGVSRWRWMLAEGHVMIDQCPRWHTAGEHTCSHLVDLQQLARMHDLVEALR
jgi:hypothetical protein